MYEITELKDGCPTSISVLKDGEVLTLNLAVVEYSEWSGPKLGFAFVSSDGKHICDSFYSGGITGFGINFDWSYHKLDENIRIVTTDLEEIIKLGKIAADREADRVARRDEAIHKACKKVNEELDKKVLTYENDEVEFLIERTDASYEPRISRRWHPHWSAHYRQKNKSLDTRWVHLDDYFTADGRFQRAKAIREFGPCAEDALKRTKIAIEIQERQVRKIAKGFGLV